MMLVRVMEVGSVMIISIFFVDDRLWLVMLL